MRKILFVTISLLTMNLLAMAEEKYDDVTASVIVNSAFGVSADIRSGDSHRFLRKRIGHSDHPLQYPARPKLPNTINNKSPHLPA